MKTTEEYLHILRKGKAYLMQYHIMRLGIFGSVARSEQKETSAIDVYFEADPMGLFTLGRLKSELETMLGCSCLLYTSLRNHYRLRGFIADEPELINKVMMGVRVFPNDDTLIDVLNDRAVQTIIISPAKMEELKKSDMADRCV